jgi:uncharacterized membrane protein
VTRSPKSSKNQHAPTAENEKDEPDVTRRTVYLVLVVWTAVVAAAASYLLPTETYASIRVVKFALGFWLAGVAPFAMILYRRDSA